MLKSISGRTALVTGGSRGIGRGIARVLSRQGAKVMIAARGKNDAQVVVDQLSQTGAGAALASVECDVSDWNSVQAAVARTAEIFGGIDILCANAGIFPQTRVVDLSPAEWDHVMATNLKSAFLTVKACIPYFEKAGKGRVILTSSITGPVTGYPGWAHYGASKAGQLGFLKTTALELARYNTTINAVMRATSSLKG